MGVPVLIMGESGSGKTYSIKNLDPETVGIFSVEKNRLPFKKDGFKIVKNANYGQIIKALAKPTLKRYVIDDSQYLLVNEFFDRAKETGFQKFTDLALNFRNLIHFISREVPDDVVVYFLHHTELADGRTKAKTIGKLLDEKLTVEGCFDIVLLAEIEGGEHFFVTQSDGYTTAKSPDGMFETKIPNDLAIVDAAIRGYWGL